MDLPSPVVLSRPDVVQSVAKDLLLTPVSVVLSRAKDLLFPLHLPVFAALIVGCSTPQRREDITIRSGDVSLAGTVVGPADNAPHPALLIIHGSGRDSRENPYYAVLADAFVKKGFVVLIYDKRGSGQSRGDWRRSPFGALIEDASAAARTLRNHPWVDSTRVGVWGGSEGAVIAPEVALRESLSFVIMHSGPGVPFWAQNLHQTDRQVREATPDPVRRRALMDLQRLKHRYARSGSGWSAYDSARNTPAGRAHPGFATPITQDDWWWAWYRTKMDYTAVPFLTKLRVPVLAVWGSEDALVPVRASYDSVAAARRGVRQAGDSLVIIDGADHTMLINGWRGVLTRGLRNRPVHLGLMAEWAERVVK